MDGVSQRNRFLLGKTCVQKECGMKTQAAPVTSLREADIRKVSVEASADPRTVRRVLRGDGTQSMACDRVRAVLRRMGIEPQLAQVKGVRR
jgi:hypothetical protein